VSGSTLIRLTLVGALVGIPAALVALAFFTAVHYLEAWLWTDLPAMLGAEEPPAYLLIGLPVIGALIVAAARLLLPGDGGHSPMDGISTKPTPVRYAPSVALAALGTLPFGLVLGPEAPVIALGSATALALITVIRVPEQAKAVLASSGSFAGISTLFGGPIVAGVMLLEAGVGMGAGLIPVLLPGFAAAAVGYLIFIGVGPYTGAPAPGLTVPDLEPYVGTTVVDLGVAVVVGIAAALALRVVNLGAERLADFGKDRFSSRGGLVAFLLVGGLAVGLLAFGAGQLGADPEDVLFSGQASIPALVAEPSVTLLVVLIVAKALGYIVSLATGFRGGPIFPALFIGVGMAAFAVQWLGTSPTLAIAIGAAAGMAAQTRLILSSMIFGALLVGSASRDVIPAVVLAAVAAYLTATVLRPPAETAAGSATGTPMTEAAAG
jgi:H+/Cl- antiporter ClcA